MSEPVMKIRCDPPSGTIILNRPHKRNALTRELISECSQAFDDLYQERQVRAVILTGSGSAFCAGMDLGELHETAGQESPEQQWHEDALAYRELVQTMLHFPKPIIAAVNGPALGAGSGLAVAADLVVAGRSARFGVPAPRRGLVAGMVTPLLVFRVGGGHASNLLLTAQTIDAETAFRIGIFHEVVGDEFVWARAHELARLCAEGAAEALALTKKMLNETVGEHLSTMLSIGAAVTATAKTTEAAAEGINAFVEKRDPRWP